MLIYLLLIIYIYDLKSDSITKNNNLDFKFMFDSNRKETGVIKNADYTLSVSGLIFYFIF
jgi:hypothetical protein